MVYEYDIRYRDALYKSMKRNISHEVLKTVLYFNIFNYPLTLKEIRKFCGVSATLDEIEHELTWLEKLGYIKHYKNFYSLGETDVSFLVSRREKGNIAAEKMIKTAQRYSRLISFFPFTRCICLSGSLSKKYADEESDADYFIITEPGRLWLCRTLLILFKKIFLLNSHKYFCLNYFIDSGSLEIQEKNVYTATELETLIPTCNSKLYRKLMQANAWTKEYFPNTILECVSADNVAANEGWVKKLAEKVFTGKLGDILDDFCYKLTLSAWKRKFKTFTETEFELNLRSKKNISKHHPRGFQLKVLAAYQEKLKGFGEKYHINIR